MVGKSLLLLTSNRYTAAIDELRSEIYLNLSDTNLDVSAMEEFTTSISRPNSPSCECNLTLSHNPLGYDGLLVILKMLESEVCPVTTLLLETIDLTTPDKKESQQNYDFVMPTTSIVGPGIKSSRLTYLDLSDNIFNREQVYILAECVRVCKSLRELICWNCLLTSIDIINLVDNLKRFGNSHKLWRWELNNNSIDDKGVTALVKSIPKLFPSLVEVSLHGNPVSGEAEKKLKTVTIIYVSTCALCIFIGMIIVCTILLSTYASNSLQSTSYKWLKAHREKLAAKKRARRYALLIEWEKTCSPPKDEEVCCSKFSTSAYLLLLNVISLLLYSSSMNSKRCGRSSCKICALECLISVHTVKD